MPDLYPAKVNQRPMFSQSVGTAAYNQLAILPIDRLLLRELQFG